MCILNLKSIRPHQSVDIWYSRVKFIVVFLGNPVLGYTWVLLVRKWVCWRKFPQSKWDHEMRMQSDFPRAFIYQVLTKVDLLHEMLCNWFMGWVCNYICILKSVLFGWSAYLWVSELSAKASNRHWKEFNLLSSANLSVSFILLNRKLSLNGKIHFSKGMFWKINWKEFIRTSDLQTWLFRVF